MDSVVKLEAAGETRSGESNRRKSFFRETWGMKPKWGGWWESAPKYQPRTGQHRTPTRRDRHDRSQPEQNFGVRYVPLI